MRSQLKKIEDLGAAMEEALILDNKYTEHSTVGLAQQWDQLDQLGMRMQHNLEQQIQARYRCGGPAGASLEPLLTRDGYRMGNKPLQHGEPAPYFCSFRNTTGVTEEALKEFSMMFK
jgi:hypothetical protein